MSVRCDPNEMPNKPDAVNPAMALRVAVDAQWRRVTDLERRRYRTIMNDSESKLQREVHELRAEVRRLKRMVEGVFVVVVVAIAVIFPQLLVLAACVGVLILFAFLVSPVRRMIFTSIFHKRDSHEYDG
jgi:hypothetical protein